MDLDLLGKWEKSVIHFGFQNRMSLPGEIKKGRWRRHYKRGDHMCKDIELGVIWGCKRTDKLVNLPAPLNQVRGGKQTEVEAEQRHWVRWEQEVGAGGGSYTAYMMEGRNKRNTVKVFWNIQLVNLVAFRKWWVTNDWYCCLGFLGE